MFVLFHDSFSTREHCRTKSSLTLTVCLFFFIIPFGILWSCRISISRPIVHGHPGTTLPYPILVLFSSTMIEKTRTITGLGKGRGDTWKLNFYQDRDSYIH